MSERIQFWAALLRDIGMILGVPSILYIAIQLYGFQLQGMQAQISALKEQNETLRERQYDRAATIIKSQKILSEIELDMIEKSISLVGDKKVNIRDFNGQLLCLKRNKGSNLYL
ncbi:MAG: hypothetical protein P8163_22775 [Candidatus Thiodiazotropha sp.]